MPGDTRFKQCQNVISKLSFKVFSYLCLVSYLEDFLFSFSYEVKRFKKFIAVGCASEFASSVGIIYMTEYAYSTLF